MRLFNRAVQVRSDPLPFDVLPGDKTTIVPKFVSTRAHPAQRAERRNWMWAPNPPQLEHTLQYIMNHWIYTGVSRLARMAASVPFLIVDYPDGMNRNLDHPMLDLLGVRGRPNDAESAAEFWEKHFVSLGVAGNVYWLWTADEFGGAPVRVDLVEPEYMRIEPGVTETVGAYLYEKGGVRRRYLPGEITHFRRSNYFSRYYGLSALQVLYWRAVSDNFMLRWNIGFFDDQLGIPSGIVIVPADTSDADMARYRAEFTAEHGEVRRVAFVKSDLGAAVWQEAGLKHKDYDFMSGHEVNRQAILEALEMPLGLLSESSTEAHALVAERDMGNAVWFRHFLTKTKLNVDGLEFWPDHKKYQCEFEDVRRRTVDWRRERDRLETDAMVLSLDEMRAREHRLPSTKEKTVAQLLMPGGAKNGDEDGKNETMGQISGRIGD
jgi:phage portal protein BeeE